MDTTGQVYFDEEQRIPAEDRERYLAAMKDEADELKRLLADRKAAIGKAYEERIKKS